MIDNDIWSYELERDPKVRIPTDDEMPWVVAPDNHKLHYVIGIIRHDKSVEVVVKRYCDFDIGHIDLPERTWAGSRWRIVQEYEYPITLDNSTLDIEQIDAIVTATHRHIAGLRYKLRRSI